MDDMYEVIKTIRAGNKVRRYHTMDLVVPETVGHHSSNVALIAYMICGPHWSEALAMAALTHDLAEQYTGDIPATAKWMSKDLSDAAHALEAEYAILSTSPLTPDESRILKIADMLDLCFKCREEIDMGNNTMRPVLRRGIAYLKNMLLPTEVVSIIKELEKEHEC